MTTKNQAWNRIDLALPDDVRSEIVNKPPYLVNGFFYSSWASYNDAGEHIMVLTKLTPDGRAVSEFGVDGTVRILMPGERGDWLCFVEGGTFLLCGVVLRTNETFAIFRVNKATGEHDLDFGEKGFKLVPFPQEPGIPLSEAEAKQEGPEGYAGTVPQFPDGKLRQAVNSGFAQFDLAGNLDTSFNEVGMRRFFRRYDQNFFTMAVHARYDGAEHSGFYYCGFERIPKGTGPNHAWVGAVDKRGTVVSGFADQGMWIAAHLPGDPNKSSPGADSAQQVNDRLYVMGTVGDRGFVVCLKLDGSVDNSFNNGNAVIFDRPEFNRTKVLAVTPHDGGILIGVVHGYPLQDQPATIVRLSSDGQVDLAFGDRGWLVTPAYPECKTLLTLEYEGQRTLELRGVDFIARYPL